MQDSLNQPPGFCPKCGYPTMPGICPECGFNVTLLNLARRPPSRRRRVRRVSLAILVVALIAAPIYWKWGWISVNWVRWAPTSVLFWMNPGGNNAVLQELLQRDGAGALSSSERDRFYRCLQPDPVLSVRPDYPTGYPIRCEILVGQGQGVGMKLEGSGIKVHIDGKLVNTAIEGPPQPEKPSRSYSNTNDLWIDLASLPPGDHELEVWVTGTLFSYWHYLQTVPLIDYHLKAKLEVTGKPITDYVKFTLPDAARIERMTSGIRIDCGLSADWIPPPVGDHSTCPTWIKPMLMMPTAGWRDVAFGAFEPTITDDRVDPADEMRLGFSRSSNQWLNLNFPMCPDSRTSGRFDLVFKPSLARAWQLGLSEVPAIEMRWEGIAYEVGGERRPPVIRPPSPVILAFPMAGAEAQGQPASDPD